MTAGWWAYLPGTRSAAEACWTKENICTLCQHTSGSRRIRACIWSPQKTDCHAVFVSCQRNERGKKRKRKKKLVVFLLCKRWCLHNHDIATPYINYKVIYNSLHVQFINMFLRQYDSPPPTLFFPPIKVTMFGYEIKQTGITRRSKRRDIEKRKAVPVPDQKGEEEGGTKPQPPGGTTEKLGKLWRALAHSGSRDRSKEGMGSTEKKEEDREKLAKSGRQSGPRFYKKKMLHDNRQQSAMEK